jgi:transcriptional regulator with XRE-family HTH domain
VITAKNIDAVEKVLWEMDRATKAGEMNQLPIAIIAEGVRHQRSIRNWKQTTLASIAGVSLSSVQRIEREEPVRKEVLAKIERALSLADGTLSARRQLPTLDELKECLKTREREMAAYVSVPVQSIQSQRQIARILRCRAVVTNEESLDEGAKGAVRLLRSLIDFCGLNVVLEESKLAPLPGERPVKRREYYKVLLSLVMEIRRIHRLAVLAGVYRARTSLPYAPSVDVAVFGYYPLSEFPGITKRRELLAPRELNFETSNGN